MKKFTFYIILIFISSSALSIEPYTGIICTDKKQKTKLEFLFKEKGEGLIYVYKRI